MDCRLRDSAGRFARHLRQGLPQTALVDAGDGVEGVGCALTAPQLIRIRFDGVAIYTKTCKTVGSNGRSVSVENCGE